MRKYTHDAAGNVTSSKGCQGGCAQGCLGLFALLLLIGAIAGIISALHG